MGGHICCLYILAIVNMWTFFYICTVLNTCFLFPRQFADILGTNQQFCVRTAQVTVQCFPQHQDPFLLLPTNRSSCFTTSTPLPLLGTLCLCFFKWLNHSWHCDKLKYMQCLQTLGASKEYWVFHLTAEKKLCHLFGDLMSIWIVFLTAGQQSILHPGNYRTSVQRASSHSAGERASARTLVTGCPLQSDLSIVCAHMCIDACLHVCACSCVCARACGVQKRHQMCSSITSTPYFFSID